MKVPRQVYAYAVCLAAIIALLITLPRIAGAIVDYRDPLHVKHSASDVDLGSFDAYKANIARDKSASEYFRWSDADKFHDPRVDYEAARAERIASVQNEARHGIWGWAPVSILALILFPAHLLLARRSAR